MYGASRYDEPMRTRERWISLVFKWTILLCSRRRQVLSTTPRGLAHVRDKMNTEIDFYANVLTVLRIFISLQFDTVMSRVTDK